MSDKKGILLLEVVMAVAILAVGLTMILRSFTNCIRALEASYDYNTAIIVAEQVMWELESKGVKPEEWESDGDFNEHPGFKWHQENAARDDLKLRKLNLDIKWERRNRDYKLRIATFVPDEEET